MYLDARREIRFNGALGPLQRTGVAGSMIWKLTESAETTQFEWTFAVGGYTPGGLAAVAPAVDGMLPQQLQRLERFVEIRRPESRKNDKARTTKQERQSKNDKE